MNDGHVEPEWARDDHQPRTTPYTADELDVLADGVISGIQDTEAWVSLVKKHGVEEARRIVRDGILAHGPSAMDERPNPN